MDQDFKVYEAYTPSGTEEPEWRAGLFTGDPRVIREWVAQLSPYWRADQVRLVERTVLAMSPERLSALREAHAETERLKARIKELEQGQ